MSGFFNELDYASYVIRENERETMRAHHARLARGNESMPLRKAMDRVKAAIGTVLIAAGQRVAHDPVPGRFAPSGR